LLTPRPFPSRPHRPLLPLQVHTEFLRRRFVADVASWACLLNALIVLGAAILPLYIVHAAGPLWQRHTVRYEQPDVVFQNRLVVEVHGLRGPALGYRQPFTAVWTTSKAANDLLGSDAARPMVVRSSTRDGNRDGMADELHLSAMLPLADDEVVMGATMLAYVDASLQVRGRRRRVPPTAAAVGGKAEGPAPHIPRAHPLPPSFPRRRTSPASPWTPCWWRPPPPACRWRAWRWTATCPSASA
jgi:hypothetical protein